MSKRPVDLQQQATAYYAEHDFDVSFFAAIWHTFKVGHLLETDLEHICRPHGISIADFHLMGAIMTEVPTRHRATDLAQWLNVSNAVLSTRIKKLQEKGLLLRSPCEEDRRAFYLELTTQGSGVLKAASDDIAQHCHFVHCINQLPEEDKASLVRIMGDLHNQLDRFSLSAGRGKP